jgi:hypothetical protein
MARRFPDPALIQTKEGVPGKRGDLLISVAMKKFRSIKKGEKAW